MPLSVASSNWVRDLCQVWGSSTPSHPLSWFTTVFEGVWSAVYPTIPWTPGYAPVVSVVSAEAVVVGNPEGSDTCLAAASVLA